jgi:Ca2+-binding EF-hand superfamily protein
MSRRHRVSMALFASALLMVPTLALAADPPASTPGAQDGHGERKRGVSVLIKALDTNQDGALSADEIANAPKSLLLLDQNQDGKISGEEFHPTLRPLQSPTAATTERLLEFDKNKDGSLTKQELPERLHGMLAQADTDKDGILTKAELTAFVEAQGKQAAPRAAERPAKTEGAKPNVESNGKDTFVKLGGNTGLTRRLSRVLAALDTDKDISISAQEIANAATSLKVLDTNNDGVIDAEELTAAGKTEFVTPKAAETSQAAPAKP